jgi:hypothetical protein
MNLPRTLLSALALLIVSASLSRAAVIASDSFTYTAGALSGANGGQGWQAGWGATSAVTVASFNGSNAAVITGGSNNVTASRQLSASVTADEVYVSMRFTMDSLSASDFAVLWLDANNNTSSTHNNERFNMGTSNSVFLARPDSEADYTVSSGTATAGVTYHLVARYYKSTAGASNPYDSVQFWLNPTNGSQGTPLGTETTPDSTFASFSYVGIRTANLESTDIFYIDDLVLATTWDDVVPVPEPGAGILAGLALLAVGVRRFRFRRVA